MAISAAFLVNGNPNPAAHAVAYGATVTLTLLSTSGANSIVWEVLGSSHPDVVSPTLNVSGTPSGQTCTFAMVADPGGTLGRSLVVRCTVRDSAGNVSRQTAVIGVANGQGVVPISAGEELERSLTHGWAPVVNVALASSGGGGGAPSGPAGGDLAGTYPNPTIAAGAIVDADVNASAAISLSKLATQAALSVVTNATNATAVPTAVAAGTDGHVFLRSGTTLAFGTITAAGITNGTITLAKLANATALSVLGRSANSAGVYADMAAATDGDCMRRSGTTIGFGAPNFAAQNITTTGAILLGTTPATSGDLRVRHGFELAGRNSANSANISLVRWGVITDTLVLGSATAGVDTQIGGEDITINGLSPVLVQINGTTCLSVTSNTVTAPQAQSVTLGASAASSGFLRVPNNSVINARNAANSGNVSLINVSGTDVVQVGGITAAGVSMTTSASSVTLNTSDVTVSTATLRFDSAQVNPTITQETDASATATGDTLTISAQSCSGTTSVTAGGLNIVAGSATGGSGTRVGGQLTLGSGLGATSDGDVTIRRGAVNVFTATSTAVAVGNSTILVESASLSGRNIVALARGSAISATQMPTNSGSGVVYLAAASVAPTANPVGGLTMYATSLGELVTVEASGGSTRNMLLGDGTNGIVLKAGGATDYSIYLSANGGSLVSAFGPGGLAISSPSHASFGTDWALNVAALGMIRCVVSSANVRSLSFFGAVASTQAADVGVLTAASGTADGTVADVTASHSQSILNNNFQDLVQKINGIRTVLRNYGLMA